jgi:hypothetical protein
MKKLILSVVIAVSSVVSWAEEPFEDYSFECQGVDLTKATLQINGGVDPSGSFAIAVLASGELKAWNGAFFMARRSVGRKYTSYRSITPETPKTAIGIDWGGVDDEGPYKGFVRSASLNQGVAMPPRGTVRHREEALCRDKSGEVPCPIGVTK